MHGPGSSLAKRIRALRLSNRLTLGDLADAVGVSKVSVYHWEIGKRKPRPFRIEALANALGVTPEYLEANAPAEQTRAMLHGCTKRSEADFYDRVKSEIARYAGVKPEQVQIMIRY